MATDGSALPAGRWTVRPTDVVDELYREQALRLTRLAMVLVGDLVEAGCLDTSYSDPVELELSALTRMIERVRAL